MMIWAVLAGLTLANASEGTRAVFGFGAENRPPEVDFVGHGSVDMAEDNFTAGASLYTSVDSAIVDVHVGLGRQPELNGLKWGVFGTAVFGRDARRIGGLWARLDGYLPVVQGSPRLLGYSAGLAGGLGAWVPENEMMGQATIDLALRVWAFERVGVAAGTNLILGPAASSAFVVGVCWRDGA